MAVKGSMAIPEIIKALKAGTMNGLEEGGEVAVKALKEAEAEMDASKRLGDSFSWATSRKTSGVGSFASEGDGVEKPNEPYAINIGTQVPYAITANYGTVNGFQFGKNGAPSNMEELVYAIEKWIKDKVRNGNWQGESFNSAGQLSDMAQWIAMKIVRDGTDGIQYWEYAINQFKREDAEGILASNIILEIDKLPNYTQKVDIK
jgi:hypothetical protein